MHFYADPETLQRFYQMALNSGHYEKILDPFPSPSEPLARHLRFRPRYRWRPRYWY